MRNTERFRAPTDRLPFETSNYDAHVWSLVLVLVVVVLLLLLVVFLAVLAMKMIRSVGWCVGWWTT